MSVRQNNVNIKAKKGRKEELEMERLISGY
jgi:hypothetical protein